MKANGTPVYARQHRRGLTMPQMNAIDLVAAGKNDTETAELLSLSRTCVTKWRLYDPVFQAALNRRRAEVWSAGIDRLRSLIPKALDTLADQLENGNSIGRLKAATEILRLARLPDGSLRTGPTEPEDIVRGVVEARRLRARDSMADLLDADKSLPPFDRHMANTWKELEALAEETDERGAGGANSR